MTDPTARALSAAVDLYGDSAWRELLRILGELADQTTARQIFRSTFDEAGFQLIRPDCEVDKQKVVLETVHDQCVAQLLEWAHADLAAGRRESRAVDLLLAYFEPYILRRVACLARCEADADRIVNDVRKRFWCRLDAFYGQRRQLQRYIWDICESAWIDDYRKNTRPGPRGERQCLGEPLPSDPELLPADAEKGNELDSVEVRIELERGMRLLSPDQKAAVEAFLDYGSWLRAEVELGVPRQTLQSRFESACRILRPRFSDEQ